MFVRSLAVFVLLILFAASMPSGARAAQDDARLDALFARLKSSGDPSEGARLTNRIWTIWIEYDDAIVDTLMREGQELMAAGRHKLALLRFDEIVGRVPAYAEGWNKRATVYFLLGEYEASVRDIQKTLALEPRHFGALSGLGLIYRGVGQDAAAVKAFEKALEFNPHLPSVRQNLRSLNEKLGRKT